MENEERLNRLRMLKDMLERHDEIFPQQRFDINTWKADIVEVNRNGRVCNTVACALGSAASYQPFMEKGFSIEHNPWGGCYPSCRENGGIYRGYDAGREFFGVTAEESEYIFNPRSYPQTVRVTLPHVVNHVEEVIKNYSGE